MENEAIKNCSTCRHGHFNDHWNIPFCYNDKECKEWELWEPKETCPDGELVNTAD